MSETFELISSGIETEKIDTEYCDKNVIIIDECLDFIINTSKLKQGFDTFKFEISKISVNKLKHSTHIYTDSFLIKDDTKNIKSIIGAEFSIENINKDYVRIITNDMFNKFIYSEIEPLDKLFITVTLNNDIIHKKDYSILSHVRIKTTDCLLKKINKNMVNLSIDFDQLDGLDQWEITKVDYIINNKLHIEPIGSTNGDISCRSKQTIFFNYSLIWDDIVNKLESNNLKYFLAKFHMTYKLKNTNRTFKLVNVSKYTKSYLKTIDNEDLNPLREMETRDELDIKLLDTANTESNSYIINLKQKEITSVKFLIKRKLGKKSSLKNLVIFQYFKKADVRDFKKFKGLSISLNAFSQDTNNPSVIINGNNKYDPLPKPMSATDITRNSLTPTGSEPMTRVSIPPTPSNNPIMHSSNTSVIKSQINEKYSQWKQSLRLMPYQCGLILIDDDYELNFADKDELPVEIRFVGVQKGYYPNLSNIKLYDLDQNKVMDFCNQFGVLCM